MRRYQPDATDALDDAINALVRLGIDSGERERALHNVFLGKDWPVSPWVRLAQEKRLPAKELVR